MGRPLLSVCCLSGPPLGRTAVILGQFREIADEIVCAVDASVTGAELDHVLPVADRVVRCEFDPSTGIERHLAWLHELSSGRWIMRVDSDEVPSTGLLAALPDVLRPRDALGCFIERRWLWPDENHYLHEPPWRFDWQPRLVRNEPTLLRFSGELHSSTTLALPFRYLDAPIYHLTCIVDDLATRKAKVDLYEAGRPDHVTDRGFPVNGYYLPERYSSHPTAAVPEADAPAIAQVLAAAGRPRAGARSAAVPLVRLEEVDRRWARRAIPDSAYAARIEPLEHLVDFVPDRTVSIPVRVHNDGTEVWPWGDFPPRIRLADRWYPIDDPSTCFEGVRSPFTVDIRPGTSEVQLCALRPPSTCGDYVLELNIVHELVRWFDAGVRVRVTVSNRTDDAGRPEDERVDDHQEDTSREQAPIVPQAQVASLQTQLAEAGDRTLRLEEELAAFRARRSVRAANTVARAAHIALRRLRSSALGTRTARR